MACDMRDDAEISPESTRELTDLDVSVHGCRLSCPDQSLELGTAVVFRIGCQFLDVNICGEQVEAFHLVGVDVQDLDTSLFIGQAWRSEVKAVGDRV